jgi:hypothetical protein
MASSKDDGDFKLTFKSGSGNGNGTEDVTATDDDDESEETRHIQKMFYIYNSVMNGWTVRMIEPDTFEFKKNRQDEMRDIYKRYFKRMATIKSPGLTPSSNNNNKSINYIDAFLTGMMTGQSFSAPSPKKSI